MDSEAKGHIVNSARLAPPITRQSSFLEILPEGDGKDQAWSREQPVFPPLSPGVVPPIGPGPQNGSLPGHGAPDNGQQWRMLTRTSSARRLGVLRA